MSTKRAALVVGVLVALAIGATIWFATDDDHTSPVAGGRRSTSSTVVDRSDTSYNPLAASDISLADGCRFKTVTPRRLAHYEVDIGTMPRWIGVIDLHAPGGLDGCITRELLFPKADGGAALEAYEARAGIAQWFSPSYPVFSTTGALVGYSVPRRNFVPLAQALSEQIVPARLVANPPTPADFSQSGLVVAPPPR